MTEVLVRLTGYAFGVMSVFPTLSVDQRRQLSRMSAQELRDMASDHLSRADDLDGQAMWLRITATALKEAASRKLADEASRSRTPARRGRKPKAPKLANGDWARYAAAR
jgi:hypothetical protein